MIARITSAEIADADAPGWWYPFIHSNHFYCLPVNTPLPPVAFVVSRSSDDQDWDGAVPLAAHRFEVGLVIGNTSSFTFTTADPKQYHWRNVHSHLFVKSTNGQVYYQALKNKMSSSTQVPLRQALELSSPEPGRYLVEFPPSTCFGTGEYQSRALRR